MSRSMWVISIIILIMMISSFWFGRNRETPPWMKCKESLFTQVVFNKCTPSSFSSPRNTDDQNSDVIEEELPREMPQN